ncbi:hypothetical protein [Planomonospora sphaerica]|nr:hypothetical protein [Planomonospora sphaerica]
MTDVRALRVLMGYDGSPAANAAVGVGALLFPGAHARIVYLWTPPFARKSLHRRLWTGASHLNDLVEAGTSTLNVDTGCYAAAASIDDLFSNSTGLR